MNSLEQLLTAAHGGDSDTVIRLLSADPSLATDSSMLGSQPIHAASLGGHPEIVELLLSRGVELDFFLACEVGRMDIIRDEIERRPGIVREFSSVGSTSLHRACYWGQVEIAKMLLANGADPNAVTRDSFLQIAPLGCAVATPDTPNPSDDESVVLALVRLLVEGGANVNAQRIDGLTALHSAAYRGLPRVIEYLLARGADASTVGTSGVHEGQTARAVALNQGQQQAAELLKRVRE